MRKIEKFLKKQLDENMDGVNAVIDSYVSSLNVYEKQAEDEISSANLEIQKRMTDLANIDAEAALNELYDNFAKIDEANAKLERINAIRNFLFEEVQTRTAIRGLKK